MSAKNIVRTNVWVPTPVTLAGADVNISTKPARLGAVYINTTLSAHTIAMKSGSTTLFTIPASAAAGTRFVFDAMFPSTLVLSPNASGTGAVTVTWDPM